MRVSAKIGIGESLRYLRKHNDFVTRFLRPGGFSPDRLIKGLAARPRRPRGEGRRLPHLHLQRARRDRGVAAAEARRPLSDASGTTSSSSAAAPPAARSRTGSAPTPRRSVLVLEAGRPRLQVGRLHPHAGRARDPDRQPVLRLEVRVRARAAHERPPHLPRPRQGARRLLEHQRDDLPARQPARLRALGAPIPGMETWDYAHCLPYFKRMESCLAGADDYRGGDGPLVLERGPGDEPALPGLLRGRAAGRLPAHRRRQRLPAGGLRGVRPQHPPRPPPQRRAGLPAPRAAADRTSRCAAARS